MTVHDSSKGDPQVVLQDRDAMRCVTLVDDDDSDDDDGYDGYNDGDGGDVSVFRRPRWIATTTRRRRSSNQRRHAEDGVGYVSWEEEVETTTRKG